MASDLRCPRCEYPEARPFVSSRTVLTVRCTQCHHTWSMEISEVTDEVRTNVAEQNEPDIGQWRVSYVKGSQDDTR